MPIVTACWLEVVFTPIASESNEEQLIVGELTGNLPRQRWIFSIKSNIRLECSVCRLDSTVVSNVLALPK